MFTKLDTFQGAQGETHCKQVKFTRFTTSGGLLTKQLRLADGRIEKTAAVHLSEGMAEVLTVDGVAGLCDVLTSLTSAQALSYGLPKNGGGRVFSRRAYEAAGSPAYATTRTEDAFTWAAGPGVLMIDCDPIPGREALSRDELLTALYDVVPALRSASHAWWPSSSSLIFDGEREAAGVRGQRVYVLVSDATDVERAGRVLVERLWLAGRGAIIVSSAGSMLERTIIDAAVYQASRLDFAAGAVCEAPLSQRRGAPLVLGDGPHLDTREALAPLLEDDEKRLLALVRASKAAARPEADRVHAEWVDKRGGAIATARGVSLEVARSVAKDAISHCRLRGDFILTTEDGREVSVAELLADRSTWHERRFRHPLEHDYPDHRIGYANLKPAGGKPFLFVHAHGGIKYTLIATARTIQVQAGAAVDNAEDVLAEMRACGRFYARGTDVCTVNADGDLIALPHHALKHGLESVLSFERFAETKVNEETGKKGRFIPCDMPDDLAKRVRELVSLGTLPRINGVVKHAVVTPSGRVLDEGYDEKTGLLLARSESRPWPRPRAHPTLEEVHQAVLTLWQPFALFPFADDTSRGVLLAALLCAPVRRALETAPAFLFAAPSAGSGKTLLAECVAELAGGAAIQSLPHDESEIEKTLVAVLRGGAPCLVLDNLSGSVDSPSAVPSADRIDA